MSSSPGLTEISVFGAGEVDEGADVVEVVVDGSVLEEALAAQGAPSAKWVINSDTEGCLGGGNKSPRLRRSARQRSGQNVNHARPGS